MFLKLFLRQDPADERHVKFQQQCEQRCLVACCDDLTHHRHIDRCQEESRFITQICCGAECDTLSPLNKDVKAWFVRGWITRGRVRTSVQRKTWYRCCSFPNSSSLGGNLTREFCAQFGNQGISTFAVRFVPHRLPNQCWSHELAYLRNRNMCRQHP